MRLSSWSKINNKVSLQAEDAAGCRQEEITVEGEIEVEAV